MYDAMAFLLEEMGRVQQAFDMMLKTFQEKVDIFMEMAMDKRASQQENSRSFSREPQCSVKSSSFDYR